MAARRPKPTGISLPATPWQGLLTTALGGTWSFEAGLARILDELEATR